MIEAKFKSRFLRGFQTYIANNMKKIFHYGPQLCKKVKNLTKNNFLIRSNTVIELWIRLWKSLSNFFWSNESPFEMFLPPNNQNYEILAHYWNFVDVVEVSTLKPHVKVIGEISFSCLSNLNSSSPRWTFRMKTIKRCVWKKICQKFWVSIIQLV